MKFFNLTKFHFLQPCFNIFSMLQYFIWNIIIIIITNRKKCLFESVLDKSVARFKILF